MSANVIAIFGPTGIGKTAVAIALAARLRARGEDPVAVSADALQVYRGLETLTGAADARDRAALEHRLIAFLPVSERCSAGRYAALARAEIDALLAAGRTPIVVGGTGLYLRAALADLQLAPPPPPGVREALLGELERRGLAALYADLARADPAAAARIAPTDTQRVVRALELRRAAVAAPPAGQPGGELWTSETRHPTRLFGLVMERAQLYARIDARVERMVAAGARAEVEAAVRAGASDTARRALGFAELLAGDVEAMKVRTRRYARRQITWMRKLPNVTLLDVTGMPPERTAAAIVASLPARCGLRNGRRSATTT